MRWTSRAGGLLATLVPCALAAACGDPELASDLNTEGPPEVTEVNVRTESGIDDPSGLQRGESATYCRSGEQYKVNGTYCPLMRDGTDTPIPGMRDKAPAVDADPQTWYVRVIFDELLDPSIEELVDGTGHITQSHPLELTCNGSAIPYDGWYDPGGTHLSYAPGPSLVATFVGVNDQGDTLVVATRSHCTIEINDNVVDKDGNAVPADQRVGPPYSFDVAPLSFSVEPADGTTGVLVDDVVTVAFNAPVDLASAQAGIEVTYLTTDEEPALVVVPGTVDYSKDADGNVDKTAVVFDPVGDLLPTTEYTVTLSNGIADVAGGELDVDDPATDDVVETPEPTTFMTTGEAG
jgi:hypothetical protein